MVPLSEILAKRQLDNELVRFNATEDWGQGRTCFGGFLTALSVVAMRDTMAIDAPLRSVQTNFVGPAAPGEIVCRVRLLRQGKNVAQVQCEMYSEEMLCATVIGVFGQARVTQLKPLRPQHVAPEKSLEDAKQLPFIPGVTPQFLQHVHMRWGEGEFPYSNSGTWSSKIYLRTPDEGISPEVQTVMLSDGPPTPALSFFNSPTMASSVSWSLELPDLPQNPVVDGWFQIDMEVQSASEGYTNLTSRLWTPAGQLASIGSQVVAVFG